MNLDRLISTLNWLLILLPISIIAGNSIINVHFTLFILIGIFYLVQKKIKLHNKFLIFSFLLFCLVLILSSFYNQFNIDKSFYYLRFFIFYLICSHLLIEKKINIKKIFYFYAVPIAIICIDLNFQNIVGYNLVGLKISENLGATSFFYDEKIAGSFVQGFGFFLIFFIFDFFKKNNFISILLKATLISIISIAIFVSLQRMPMIIWIMFLSIYGLIFFKTKLISVIFSFVFLFVFVNNFASEKSKIIYKSFFSNALVVMEKSYYNYETNKNKKRLEEIRSDLNSAREFVRGSGHANLFANALYIWEQNKFLGIGYKNFYNECAKRKLLRCSTHPHNYYLDILVSTGVIGLSIFLIFLITIFIKSIKILNYNYQRKMGEKININLILLINYLMVFFPFKSSGSFFTTSNATYIILILSLLTSQLSKKIDK